jgi:hypothetical protein
LLGLEEACAGVVLAQEGNVRPEEQLAGLSGQAEHPLQNRELAVDLRVRGPRADVRATIDRTSIPFREARVLGGRTDYRLVLRNEAQRRHETSECSLDRNPRWNIR